MKILLFLLSIFGQRTETFFSFKYWSGILLKVGKSKLFILHTIANQRVVDAPILEQVAHTLAVPGFDNIDGGQIILPMHCLY